MSTPEANLRAAAHLIESVLDRLDLEEGECPCCRSRRWSHYGHMRLHERIGSLPKKLRETAGMIERGNFDCKEKVRKGEARDVEMKWRKP